jgi:putative PIN family toxin of toxin-antitoxin system
MIRVVLDTNVVVSALLFRGSTSRLVPLWQSHKFLPLLSKEMRDEYLRVLSYPKFHLTTQEASALFERQLLFFARPVIAKRISPVIREDPSDDIFLACAAAGRAEFIVSGDRHLLALKRYLKSRIVSVDEFYSQFL